MASFTQSVREILQFNKRPQESLTNISDVYAIAHRTLFKDAPINVLDEQYREKFETGFALHFMNEELGYETFPLWQIALNEKLFNSGSYINKIFENLDKEIFADYNVKNANRVGSATSQKNDIGSSTSQTDDSGTTSNLRNVLESGTGEETKNLNDTTSYIGSEGHMKSGKDTIEKKGSELDGKFGKDSLEKKGSEAHILDANEQLGKEGSEEQAHTGTDTTTGSNQQYTDSSNASANFVNGIQIQSDTPMGSVENLHASVSPVTRNTYDTNSVTVGEDTETFRTYSTELDRDRGYDHAIVTNGNYMSAAAESGQTTTNSEEGNEYINGANTSELEHGLTVTTSFTNRKDVTGKTQAQTDIYGKRATVNPETGAITEGAADARKDESIYGSYNQNTYGKKITNIDASGNVTYGDDPRKDTSEYDSGESTRHGYYWGIPDPTGHPGVYGWVEDVNGDKAVSDHTGNVVNSDTRETNDSNTGSSTNTSTTSASTANDSVSSESSMDTTDQTDYNINWEMLYRSMPLLNKVWEIFDDLFMIIF